MSTHTHTLCNLNLDIKLNTHEWCSAKLQLIGTAIFVEIEIFSTFCALIGSFKLVIIKKKTSKQTNKQTVN